MFGKFKIKYIWLAVLILIALPVSVLATSGISADTPTIGIFSSIFGTQSLAQIIVRFVQLFLVLVGVIFVFLLIYAGFIWMTSAGDPEKVTKAKQIILTAVIGIIIIFSSFAIATFVYNTLGGVTGGTGESGEPIEICIGCDPWSFYSGEKFSNLYSFSDASVNWKKEFDIRTRFTGTINVPKSATLEVGVYAHNYLTYGSINALSFWELINNASTSLGNFTITSTTQKSIGGNNYSAVYGKINWNTSADGYLITTSTNIFAGITNNRADDFYSRKFRIRFLPKHCFNNIRDEGETGVDCGGECGNCPGSSCKKSDQDSCSNDNCASGICSDACICVGGPRLNDPCGYDSRVCNLDQSTCGDSLVTGLTCQNCQNVSSTMDFYDPNCNMSKNCTCQSRPLEKPCVYNADSTQNPQEICSIGGCPGVQVCTRNNVFSPCQDIATDSCIPYLGKKSDYSLFSWGFLARKIPQAGMSCSSDLWNDGTCNANGCLDSNLACDFSGSTDEGIELSVNPQDRNRIGDYFLASSPLVVNKAITSSTLDNSLIAYWSFDGDSPLVDSKNRITLSNSSAVNFGSSLAGNKAEFSVADQKLSSNSTTLKPAGAFTVSAWTKLDELSGQGRIIASTYKFMPSGRSFGWSLGREFGIDTAINFSVARSDNDLFRAWSGNFYTAPNLNRWVHVAGVFDPVSRRISLYIDGQLATNASLPAGFTSIDYDSATDFSIGHRSDDPNAGAWNGSIDEVRLFNKALTAGEIRQEYNRVTGYRAVSEAVKNKSNKLSDGLSLTNFLSANSIGSEEYPVFVSSSLSQVFPLSKNQGSIFLLDNEKEVVDYVSYGAGNPIGFSPASIGKGDSGLWQYYPQATAGKNNSGRDTNPQQTALSEMALAHDPCTCVPRSQLCRPGTIDKQTCAPVGLCAQQRVCSANGSYGACVQVDPNCISYPAIASSTLAVFSWGFGANRSANLSGPMVVVGCSGQADCRGIEASPSPSPWEGWNKVGKPNLNITNPKACLNAIISARFSQLMDSATINSNNIKLYKSDVSQEITVELDDDKKSFELRPSGDLSPDSDYIVALSKDIKDELGRNLRANQLGVKEENCPSSVTNSVCWKFKTRETNEPLCEIGCVGCSPDKYTASYFDQKTKYKVFPVSEDNVCLLLDRTDYAWDWSEQEQSGGAWSNPNNVANAFSALLDSTGLLTLTYNQSSNTRVTGRATTTAQKESNWKPYQATRSWFGEADTDFFKIIGQEVDSQIAGECRVHNNFTDPVVIENQYCTKNSDPAKQILQSPSPWKGQQDACINASIFVLFSRNMENASLLNSIGSSGGLNSNIKVYKCNSEDSAATSSAGVVGCNLVSGSIDWTASVFNYSHPNLTTDDLQNIALSNNQYQKPEGLVINPPDYLENNSWYRIEITGGQSGVRGGVTTTASQEVAEGILRVPQDNARMVTGSGSSGYDSYYWYFKTGQEECPVDGVNVLPQVNLMRTTNSTSTYSADPFAGNCNHLNASRYLWQWNSVINPISDGCNNNTGDAVATVCPQGIADCDNSFSTSTQGLFQTTVFGKSEGTTKIKARAVGTGGGNNGTCSNDKFGFGNLQIGFGGFRISSNKVTNSCLNTEIDLTFSKDADSSKLLNGVKLYQCTDTAGTNCSTQKSIILQYPTSSIYTNRASFLASPALNPSTTYRVVVSGGANGVVSAGGMLLENLNYASGPVTSSLDSYSFTFRLSDNARICEPVTLDGFSPCTNGIWWLTADSKVDNLNLKIYKGSTSDGAYCKSDSEMRQLGFWSAIWNNILKSVKRFFGSQAIAADFWCQVADTGNDGINFNADDFEKMAMGNFKKNSNPKIDDASTEVFGYSEESGNYKINLLNTDNWAPNTEYKIVASYSRNGAIATITKSLKTGDRTCQLTGVRFDIWPKGQTLSHDAFFCQGENCGRFSKTVYDDDMSAPWTKTQSENGYNLDKDLNVLFDLNYKPGNQHLYRIWGLSGSYVIKESKLSNYISNSNSVALENIGATTVLDEIIPTRGYGRYWVTAGDKAGKSLLTFQTSTEGDIIGSLPIYTYFCNNPWPASPNFPYSDSSTSCPANEASCINTNFSTFYCRDAGVAKRCYRSEEGKDVWGKTCSMDDCPMGESCNYYTLDDLPELNFPPAVTSAPRTDSSLAVNLKDLLFRSSSTINDVSAIGIRIYNNTKHLSPLRWYQEQFNRAQTGNPTALVVDGYEAIREGRTTYVSAGDLDRVCKPTHLPNASTTGATCSGSGADLICFSNSCNTDADCNKTVDGKKRNYEICSSNPRLAKIYSNIYLMSYSEGASAEFQEIYKQMVANWFFNAGPFSNSGLEDRPGRCSEDNTINCYNDLDCLRIDKGHCLSDKAKLTRDTKRLADAQDIIKGLFAYASYKRCSNDYNRGCVTNSDCSGNGVCGNYYPILDSGTYIVGKTFSTWPSWQNNLAKLLGLTKLPIDPLNKFIGCLSPYDPITCWNELNKTMQTPTANSAVYYYKVVTTTPSNLPESFRLYLRGEFNSNGLNWQPNWSEAGFYTNVNSSTTTQFNPFGGYNLSDMPNR